MVITLLIVFGVVGIVGVLILVGRREYRAAESDIQAISVMSISEARSRAESLIQSGAFSVVPTANAIAAGTLPKEMSDLFQDYQEISRDEFWLGHAALQEAARMPDLIKVGGDSDFEELLVRPNDDTLLMSYPPGTLGVNPETLPSVWHRILIAAM
jgi:hypothetical protein